MDVTYIIERRRSIDRREKTSKIVHFLENSDRRRINDRRSRIPAKKVITVSDFDELVVELEQIPDIDRYDVRATVDDDGNIFKVSICTNDNIHANSAYDVKRTCTW